MKAKQAFAIAALIGLFLCACDPAKRAQRKQDKLVDKATASRAVLARLYPVVISLWPCANDSTATFAPGRVDSPALAAIAGAAANLTPPSVNPVETPDFGLYADSITKKLVDSLRGVCGLNMMASFDSGYARAAQDCRKIKIPVRRPDTLKISVLDRRAVQTAYDSLHARDKTVSNLQGQNQTLHDQAAKDRKAMIIAIVIGAILLIVVIYLLIRKFI